MTLTLETILAKLPIGELNESHRSAYSSTDSSITG